MATKKEKPKELSLHLTIEDVTRMVTEFRKCHGLKPYTPPPKTYDSETLQLYAHIFECGYTSGYSDRSEGR